ncbi:hypothetical protein [Arthrobacter woluwensis]|uniref:hypothetical protein n=1 Tax=Arthrobacter woluwensis TaxID=156980 RepID=UPI0037F18571
MSKRPTIAPRNLDAPFDLSEDASCWPRRWPRAGIRAWHNTAGSTTLFLVTFWSAPGVQFEGLYSAEPWFVSHQEAIDHARLVIGAHRRSGVTLSGEPNPDYLR